MKKIIYAMTLGLFLSLFFLSSCEKDKIDKPGKEKDTVVTPKFPPMDNSIVFDDKKPNENLLQLLAKIDPATTVLGKGRVEINDEQLKEIKDFTDNLVKDAKNNTEKYVTIFKWVIANIKYEQADNRAYTVFKEIPSFIANGMYVGVGGHAWNYAYIDGKWVIVDATNKRGYRADDFQKF